MALDPLDSQDSMGPAGLWLRLPAGSGELLPQGRLQLVCTQELVKR